MRTGTETISPITRFEDHDKIDIPLNEEENVENVSFHGSELREFEAPFHVNIYDHDTNF